MQLQRLSHSLLRMDQGKMIPSRPITTPKSWKKGKKKPLVKRGRKLCFINEFQASIIRQLYTDVWFSVPSRQGRLFEKKPYSQKLPSNSWRETNRTFHFPLLSELNDYLNTTNLCIHLERVHNLTRFFVHYFTLWWLYLN